MVEKLETKKKLEERYLMLQLIGTQIKEFEKEISALESRALDFSSLRSSLGDLAKTAANAKAFSPLGLGIYTEAEIKNTKNVLVNVGANVFVKKTIEDTQELLQKQIEQADSVMLQLTQNLTALATRAQEIENEIQELVK